jgi:O-antigen biosynthesis protein
MRRDRDADLQAIKASSMFESDWYRARYRDVDLLQMDPLEHFIEYGGLLRRSPSPRFDTRYYLDSNPDVACSGINPLVHYVFQGRSEGRLPLRPADDLNDRLPLPSGEAEFMPRAEGAPPANVKVKAICFYLPQFHEIAENNAWWGSGFTEWSNVRPARAQFKSHYQPHVPVELGYYDLLDSAVQQRQVDLAKLYGLGGFCFYFYWFGGKTLLERPVASYLEDSSLDFPFCLCWANENWSRRWDGLDSEILIAQEHSPEDDIAFISHLSDYLRDDRYVRVDGKPLLLVYRPNLLPCARDTAARWRAWCRVNGIGEIHLAYTQSFEAVDPAEYGFDSAIEFPPNNSAPPNLTNQVEPLSADYRGTVYDWRVLVERSRHYQEPTYRLFRSVCPAWDNTARRGTRGTVFLHSSPDGYREWLGNAVAYTERTFDQADERLVFVNAWNEWAEGAHLEPDQKYGYAYLQATRDALSPPALIDTRSVLVVTHDCHPHGAQFLILQTARELQTLGFQVCVLALDGGKLWDEFAKFPRALDAAAAGPEQTRRFLSEQRAAGFAHAITSTVVAGTAVPWLKKLGYAVLSLIHELPGVIRAMKQERNAALIAAESDKVVFPAAPVAGRFCEIAAVAQSKAVIRPQGLLRRNPYKHRKTDAHRTACERLGLPLDSQIILNVAYLDRRKGPDLFVEIAAHAVSRSPSAVFLWIGHAEPAMLAEVQARVAALGLSDKVKFIGFDADPLVYYAAASVYALTSREDPFPNVVLESAEVDVPVVAFEGTTGASSFILERGGRLASALDCADFARCVLDLLQHPPAANHSPVGSLRQYALDLLFHLGGLPRVSVVVPNYNYAQHMQRRLESIAAQSLPAYELIVLDDHSEDASVQVIASALERMDCDSRLVVNAENSGSVFRQWAKGARLAQGDLLWIAEADDIAEPAFLATLADGFRHAEVVMAYCQSKQIDQNGTLLAPDYLEYTKDISEAWRTSYLQDGSDEVRDALSIKNTIPNVSAVLFRREALLKALDGIGDALFSYQVAGDWLVYVHALRHGSIYYHATALNSHRRHTGSVTNSTNTQRHVQEVADVQEVALAVAGYPESAVRRSRGYLDRLHEHFGIPKGIVQASNARTRTGPMAGEGS